MKVPSVLLIGPTGSGKSPLGDHIEAHGLLGRRCHHFDFGHQLRLIASEDAPPPEFTKKEHQFIRDVIEKALLLEREHFPIAEKIVSSFLGGKDYKKGDIMFLNGLPRHIEQAVDMERIVDVCAILVLECTAEVVHERIMKNTGGDRTGRGDDDIALIEKKLKIFKDRTEPLIEHYSTKGCRTVRLPVTACPTGGNIHTEMLGLITRALINRGCNFG